MFTMSHFMLEIGRLGLTLYILRVNVSYRSVVACTFNPSTSESRAFNSKTMEVEIRRDMAR